MAERDLRRMPRRARASRRSSTIAAGARRPRARRAALLLLSGLRDEDAVLRAVRLRLQPAARLYRPAVVRPRGLLRRRRLFHRPCGQGLGLAAEAGILIGVVGAALLGLVIGFFAIRRQGIYFAMITLALSQMFFFFCVQAHLHRRRGRHPGRAARPPVRADRPAATRSPCTTSCWRCSCSASSRSGASSTRPSA